MPSNPFSTESVANAASNAKVENASQQDLYDIASKSLAVLKDLRAGIDDLNDFLQDDTSTSRGTPNRWSQTDAKNYSKSFKGDYDDRYRTWGNKSATKPKNNRRIEEYFKDAFYDSLSKSKFGESIEKSLSSFSSEIAKGLKVDFQRTSLSEAVGKQLGDVAAEAFSNSQIAAKLSGLADSALSTVGTKVAALDFTAIAAKGTKVLDTFFGTAAKASASLAAVAVALKVIDVLSDSVKGVITGIKAFASAGKRYEESRQKNIKLAEQRIQQDVETMVKYPFEILAKAANALYETWNKDLAIISSSQQYTKADVQDLMSTYAARLQAEGLSKYVDGSVITDNLSKVLESGLSGAVAEEFAYLATVLHAAIPTQDFFDYAATYSSIAANAIKQGESQQAAIQKANESLTTFASGLLYAGRELSGGFTTGLQDAKTLFEQATKIAQASRTANINDISSVLLAVRGEVGAIAPDLASSITDTIYQTLTGGNSSSLVALRSLAGVNASNTEFLKAVADSPKAVFSAMFSNLGKMYTQSPDAYMEKAEGYAQLFGLSPEAFQRIDFNSLASAISSMNMNNGELAENMQLLLDGQTTTTAEQLKMQQINQYMLEEGLSLVIDNEAAQFIQQHMWDEQIARELQEATYAVELKGAAMEALELIRTGIQNLTNLLNPKAWGRHITNAIYTANEGLAQSEDIKQLLELGKVGQGNAQSMYQLTTVNKYLDVIPDLLTLMGGMSNYAQLEKERREYNSSRNSYLESGKFRSATKSAAVSTLSVLKSAHETWKSYKDSVQEMTNTVVTETSAGTKAASASAAAIKSRLDKMVSDDYLVTEYVKKNKTYDEWAASAKQFGIEDLSAALKSAGYNETSIRQYFEELETQEGIEEQHAIQEHEKKFRESGMAFWDEKFFGEYKDPMFTLFETNNTHLATIIQNQLDWQTYFQKEWIETGWSAYVSTGTSGRGLFNKFYSEFMKYFINHTYYSSTSGYKYSDVEAIQKKAKAQEKGDTVYALAEMLTKNLVDLQDPTMQTNAILSQILIVVSAIMNQNNELSASTGQSSLLDSLSAMALGITANSAS